jgi:flagellar hook-length control protein FliK
VQFIPTISPVPSVAPKAAATPSEPKAKSSSDFANLLASQPVRDAKAPTTGDTSTPVDSTTATGETDKSKQDEGKTLLDDLLAALGKLDAALQGDQPVDPTLVDNVNAALAAFANYLGVDIATLQAGGGQSEGGSAIDPTSLLGQLTQKASDVSKLLGAGSDLGSKLDALMQQLQAKGGLSGETLAKLGFALEPNPLPAPELATPELKLPESTITKAAETAAAPKPAEIKPAEPAPVEAKPAASDKAPKATEAAAPAPTKEAHAKPKAENQPAAEAEQPADPNPALPGTSAVAKLEVVGGVRAVQAAYQAPPTQVNVPQLAFDIVRHVQAGNTKFHVRLDPPELGRIDVRLDVDRAGNVTTRLTVEKAETLDLLQRDQRGLEKALAQAGLEGSKTNLEFSLRQNPSSQRDAQDQDSRSPFATASGSAANDDGAEPATITQYRGTASAGGLNLFV